MGRGVSRTVEEVAHPKTQGSLSGGWRRAVAMLGAVLVSVFSLVRCSPGDRPEILALATAGTGGVYYVLGGSIAEIWSRGLPDQVVVAEVTGGSV